MSQRHVNQRDVNQVVKRMGSTDIQLNISNLGRKGQANSQPCLSHTCCTHHPQSQFLVWPSFITPLILCRDTNLTKTQGFLGMGLLSSDLFFFLSTCGYTPPDLSFSRKPDNCKHATPTPKATVSAIVFGIPTVNAATPFV